MLKEDKNAKYRRFVEQLYIRCQEIQMENERYVYRLMTMKKMIKRRTKEVAILKNRLDKYNDGWRQVPIVAPHRTRKTELKKGPKPKNKNPEQKTKSILVKKQKNTEKTNKTKGQNQQNLSQNNLNV